MSAHQCPKCELRFTWKTELDVHCRDEHPDFHHDYPTKQHLLLHPHEAESSPPTQSR